MNNSHDNDDMHDDNDGKFFKKLNGSSLHLRVKFARVRVRVRMKMS